MSSLKQKAINNKQVDCKLKLEVSNKYIYIRLKIFKILWSI